MADLVDIVIPANGQPAAEALGLKVHRSVTTGALVRRIPRDEAEIAVECLRDWGVCARIRENALQLNPRRNAARRLRKAKVPPVCRDRQISQAKADRIAIRRAI